MPKRAEYWNPANSCRLLAEAKRHWDVEQHRSKITTIQAAMFVIGANNLGGADAIGWRYTSQAIGMARELGLFSSSDKWYGDVWQYPLDQIPTTAHHGYDFKARAELITILN